MASLAPPESLGSLVTTGRMALMVLPVPGVQRESKGPKASMVPSGTWGRRVTSEQRAWMVPQGTMVTADRRALPAIRAQLASVATKAQRARQVLRETRAPLV